MRISVRRLALAMCCAVAALVIAAPSPASAAASCPTSLIDGQSCTVATLNLGYISGPVALNAAVVVDDSGTGVDYQTYRSYLQATIFCRRGSTVIFSTGGIRNIWKGATAGVYPRGLLMVATPSTSTPITCTLEAKQTHLDTYSARSYAVRATPYISQTYGGAGASSAGPNRDFAGNWGTASLVNTVWPVGTEKGQVVRQQWTSSHNTGSFNVASSTNLTSCHFHSDTQNGNPCNEGDLPGGDPNTAPSAYVTVNLWAWQTNSSTDLTICGAPMHPTPVTYTISSQVHHLTVPTSGTLARASSCSGTVVMKVEIKVSGVHVYTSNVNTSVGGYET